MSDNLYAVEQEILGKKYSILLTHLVGAKVDRVLKKLRAETGYKLNFTGMLIELVQTTVAFVAEEISAEEATNQVYNVLDLDTLFAILPIVVREDINAATINDWLDKVDIDGGFTLFVAASWLSEAAVQANIVVVKDPTTTLLILRLLRGTATETEKEQILEAGTKALAEKEAAKTQTEEESTPPS